MGLCFLNNFSVLIRVNQTRHFWIGELQAIHHCENPCWLLSMLRLAATALHATWFRTQHILSRCLAWGCTVSKQCNVVVLCSRADSLHLHVILREWIAFYSVFLNIHFNGVLTALAWLVPHETAAISARSVYTIHPCTMSLHARPHM